MNFFSVSVMILQKPLAMSLTETKKRQTAFMDLKCGKIFGEYEGKVVHHKKLVFQSGAPSGGFLKKESHQF